MPEMYTKCMDGVPYRYMYGDESAATALYFGDGYKTPEEAIEAYEREQLEQDMRRLEKKIQETKELGSGTQKGVFADDS